MPDISGFMDHALLSSYPELYNNCVWGYNLYNDNEYD